VEVNWPDSGMLDRSVVTDLQKLPDPQTGKAARAVLYL
jgi:hypothetical protein